jgi:hypothetical protein
MKAGKTRKAQTNKTNYMSDEAFADLKEAMEDALAFERGKPRDLKVTRIQAPHPQRRNETSTASYSGTRGRAQRPSLARVSKRRACQRHSRRDCERSFR